MEATDVNARWQSDMAPFFEHGPAAGFERLDEVFHLG
jgi:L-rhamnose mutarotase